MHAGFPIPGATRREYNVLHVRQLLQRIPTESPTGGHVPFVISDRSIDEWVVHMNRSEDVMMQTPSSSISTVPRRETPVTFAVSPQDRSLEEWDIRTNRSEEAVMPSPSPTPTKSVVRERNPLLNQLETWCDKNEHDDKASKDPDLEIPQPVAQIASIPTVRPVVSTPPVTEITAPSNDAYSQLYARLHQVQVGKELVRLVYQDHMDRLAAEKAKLVKTARAILEAQRVLDTVIGDTRGVTEEVGRLLELGGQ